MALFESDFENWPSSVGESRFFFIRPLSLHCLVDEVLRCGEIMPGKKKTDISLFVYFFL